MHLHSVAVRCLSTSGLLLACNAGEMAPQASRVDEDATGASGLLRVAVPELRHQGLSGVTRDDDGHFWAVAEERAELVRFDASWDPASRRTYPIVGPLGDLELESVESLGGGRFVLGTETNEARSGDRLLVARLVADQDQIVIEHSSELPWTRLYGAPAPGNRGIEGLCAVGDQLFAAGEWYSSTPLGRFAPIVRGRVRDGVIEVLEAHYVRLTSATGKISALDCSGNGGEVVVHAVERHHGTTRILRFSMPSRPTFRPIEPVIVRDLSSIDRSLPNVEGLAVADGRFVLVSDHDVDEDRGTTELLTVVQRR